MIVREHNRVLFSPVLFYAGGMYRAACEQRAVEWDDKYEFQIMETTE